MEETTNSQLAAVLEYWSVQELIDAGKAIEDLEEHEGFQAVNRLLTAASEFAVRSLVHAPKASEGIGAVQKRLGLVQGLDILAAALPTIRRKAEEAQAERDAAAERADAERQAAT